MHFFGSAVAVGLGELMPMYWTPTCWRSNCGFFGLTARMMTRTRRARKEKSKKRQQQQPLKEAEEEEEYDDLVG
ncbi:hypothetical protein C1H46_030341 [Malus baccata]|uniref:Uncharacterized protein n=1 Tax=Malus baccata TaxID=106549 RepID=A0A540LCA3_MALBA|nr:hypothetical protein C1H46_030341 [Malus baccata]